MSLKVLAVVDKEGTAIDRLAKGVAPFMDAIEYNVISVHPKKPDPAQLALFEQLGQEADIIDFQYWRTALMLLEKYPWVKDKKKILFHYNPYSIKESDWSQFDKVTADNKTIHKDLPGSEFIPLAIDTDFWTFNPEWKPNRNVIMVANRIESKKGILEVAIACGEAGLRLKLVGAISNRDYFDAIIATGAVDFYEQISDQELKDLYYDSTIHVCNSVDGFESGTMPILEAMLCGVPVLTRLIGHVPDFYDKENVTILDCENNDVLKIKETLEDMINDKSKLATQREKGWKTAKGYSNERRAYRIMRAYRSLFSDTPVSVIVPIFDKPEVIRQCLNAVAEQDYDNIEIIVCDDEIGQEYSDNWCLVDDFKKTVNFPVRYISSAQHIYATLNESDYGLARARNLGAIEATSDILIFCDQRMIMQPGAIRAFVDSLQSRFWLYGDKGTKKDFVENFSCVYRQDFMDCGMFNERIDEYGGQSQEIRSRIRTQGFSTPCINEAKAVALGKSGNRHSKRAEIIRMKNRLWAMGLE